MVEPMRDRDFEWAAALMERRRAVYERFAPVFWKPAENAAVPHAAFLRSQVESGSAVGLRSEVGFVVAAVRADHYDVDDFAVEPETEWSTQGRQLLQSVPEFGPLDQPARARVVTACQDLPKRRMLEALGLRPATRWWVKELRPAIAAEPTFAQVGFGSVKAMFVPAPPVYAPGGAVCILGDMEPYVAVEAAEEAEAQGAVLAVVTRQASPSEPPEDEPMLATAGFDNVSVFFEGPVAGP